MVFAEDELHCDIFALVSFIQWIFVEPYEFANISWILFFSSIVGVVVGPSIFYISRFQSHSYMFLAWLFEPMARATHFGCIELLWVSYGLHDRYTCSYYL